MQDALQQLPAAKQAAKQIATIPGYGPLGSTCLGYTLTRLPVRQQRRRSSPRPASIPPRRLRPETRPPPAEQARTERAAPHPLQLRAAASRTRHWQPYYAAQLAKGSVHRRHRHPCPQNGSVRPSPWSNKTHRSILNVSTPCLTKTIESQQPGTGPVVQARSRQALRRPSPSRAGSYA